MALQKAITNPQTGVTALYWRLVSITLDALNGRGVLVLAGYTSAAIRGQPDGVPVDQRSYQIDQPAFAALAGAAAAAPTVFGVIATAAYGYIKSAPRQTGPGTFAQSEFADAEDV